MDEDKRKKLEAAGWQIGSAEEFLNDGRDTIFQRDNGTWGWYNDGWQDGDNISYPTREAAVAARDKYATELMNDLVNHPEKFY